MNPIRKYRKDRNLTLHQMAELLETSKANVSRWESETRFPMLKTAMEIEARTKGKIKWKSLRPETNGAAQ